MRPVVKPPYTYSEQEAALVLKRAAELQQNENGIDGRVSTLAELEVAAEEAGIGAALVRRAATELRRAAPVETRDNVMLGGPGMIVLEAVVEGEIEPDCHEHLVGEIRRRTGEHGTHDILGKTLTWTTTPVIGQGMPRMITICVTPRSGVTTIRIEERLGSLAGALFGGIVGGVGGGGSGLVILPFLIGGVPALIPVGLAVWVGGVYGLVRRMYGRKSRERKAMLGELLAELVITAEESVAGAG
jgi:hypothetical protein